jgi:tetratricopeptide (TPR) repeat protein
MALCQRAAELRPDNADAQFNLGVISEKLGQNAQATEAYKRATQLQPDFLDAYFHVGALYRKAGNFQDALRAFKQTARLRPGDAEPYYMMGLVATDLQREQEAIDQFKQAVAADSKNYHAYKGLGIAYATLNNFKEAEKAQRKCLEINADFADARNDLGASLMYLGRREEARKEWLTAYASPFNPSPDQTAWNLGNSYAEESNHIEATRWYQASLQHNPSNSRSIIGLASTLIAQNRLDDAIVGLEKSTQSGRENAEMLLTLGDAYYRAGRFAEARARLEAAIRKDPAGAGKRATRVACPRSSCAPRHGG